jgi:hypothetical protein
LLSTRDRRALIWGGAAIALLLLYLLTRGGGSEPSSVELVQPAARTAAPPQPVAVTPPPPIAIAPTLDLSQLRLYGVMGGGAVIGMADGTQRFVAVGREIVPGVTLRRVEVHHAVLATQIGEVRLGFDGVAQPQAAPAAPAPPAEAAQREESLRYRLGLAPRMAGGRIDGYTVRPGASLPALERAGIRPGDVILRVNGSQFDEERLSELAWQIANSTRVEFEVERGGRPIRMALPNRQQ